MTSRSRRRSAASTLLYPQGPNQLRYFWMSVPTFTPEFRFRAGERQQDGSVEGSVTFYFLGWKRRGVLRGSPVCTQPKLYSPLPGLRKSGPISLSRVLGRFVPLSEDSSPDCGRTGTQPPGVLKLVSELVPVTAVPVMDDHLPVSFASP